MKLWSDTYLTFTFSFNVAGGFVSNHVRNLIYEEQSLSAQSHELWFSLFQWLIAQAMA